MTVARERSVDTVGVDDDGAVGNDKANHPEHIIGINDHIIDVDHEDINLQGVQKRGIEASDNDFRTRYRRRERSGENGEVVCRDASKATRAGHVMLSDAAGILGLEIEAKSLPKGQKQYTTTHRKAAIVKKRDIVIADMLPESDPAFPIVMAILKVVPASGWAFARPQTDGELAHLLSSGDDSGAVAELAELKTERSRQRAKLKGGSRIASTLGSLGDYESGITLLFADGRASFGILTLMRTSDLGPFTSSEIAMLTLALDAASERLSALRFNASALARATPDDGTEVPGVEKSPEGEAYLLDSDLEIVMTWTSPEQQRRTALTGLQTRLSHRLPAVLEETVSDLIAGWKADPATQLPGVARPVPFLVVRTQPVTGPTGLFIGVRVDRFKPANSLVAPAARFRITPRELEVLALLLDGAKLEDIAELLHITTSTVQDHIKSMVDKTKSRNRTELVARVLGWESAPEPL